MKTQNELNYILDNFPAVVCSTDSQGIFLQINKGGIKVLGGKSKVDFIGKKSVYDFFDIPYDLRNFQKILYRNSLVKNFNTTFRCLDQQSIKVGITISVVTNKASVIGYKALIIERADKLQTNIACPEALDVHKTIVENSLISLSIHHKGIVRYANKRYCAAIGYPMPEIIGKPFWFAIHPSDRSKVKELALKVESGDIGDTRVTFRVKKKDHSISWVEARITHARINDDRIAVVSSFGVTARKQAEKEIHKLSERIINIKEAERARLAADLHDELGQKLAAIHLEIDLLHGMIKPEDLKQQQSCQNITENVEKIATILRRNSLYKRPQMLNKVFLVTAVKQHIEDFNHSFPAIKVSFRRMGFKTRLAPEVELAIYRVIQESMTNIAKHAKANSVDIILTYNHPYVYLTISDDGIGFMNARDERFSKNSKEGIGLYSMKDRITSLGGIFDVKTTRGKGTVIRAEIPV